MEVDVDMPDAAIGNEQQDVPNQGLELEVLGYSIKFQVAGLEFWVQGFGSNVLGLMF